MLQFIKQIRVPVPFYVAEHLDWPDCKTQNLYWYHRAHKLPQRYTFYMVAGIQVDVLMCRFVLVITPPSGSQRFTDCVSLNFISLPLPVQANPDTRFWTETLAPWSRPRVEPPAVQVVYFLCSFIFFINMFNSLCSTFCCCNYANFPKVGFKKGVLVCSIICKRL